LIGIDRGTRAGAIDLQPVPPTPTASASEGVLQWGPSSDARPTSITPSLVSSAPVSEAQNLGGVSIVPELSVRRGREAVGFYERAFGAVEVYRVGGTDENPDIVAQLSVGSASFWVSDEAPASANFSPESVGGGTVRMLLIVDDPRSAFERAIAAGASEVYPVTEQHGWLLGRVEDPFGHHWEIGTPVVPWPPPDGRPHGSHQRSPAV
jgi:PhnB protein